MSEKKRPDDIPEADWQNILKGSAFAKAVGTWAGDAAGEFADHWLDEAGEIEQQLNALGYVVVRADAESKVRALLQEHSAEKDLIFDDLRAILRALGLGDHARPIPAHDVVQREILPRIKALADNVSEVQP